MITTLSANLGTIVRENSQEWNAAKNQININWLKNQFHKSSGEYASYAFEYSGPKNLTAYILCASDETFDQEKFIDVETKMIEIEKIAGRRYETTVSYNNANGGYLMEPSWYDPTGKEQSGGIALICDYYVHGNPKSGFVAYFAENAHDYICGNIENGICTNYAETIKAIQNRMNIDWYKEKFSGYYVMKNHKNAAEREAAIEKAAQELLEFYKPYYESKVPQIFENNGTALEIKNPYANGADENGKILDDVFILLKDNNGNYYEPIKYEVPDYFR